MLNTAQFPVQRIARQLNALVHPFASNTNAFNVLLKVRL
jgi:hypothetical protein